MAKKDGVNESVPDVESTAEQLGIESYLLPINISGDVEDEGQDAFFYHLADNIQKVFGGTRRQVADQIVYAVQGYPEGVVKYGVTPEFIESCWKPALEAYPKEFNFSV